MKTKFGVLKLATSACQLVTAILENFACVSEFGAQLAQPPRLIHLAGDRGLGTRLGNKPVGLFLPPGLRSSQPSCFVALPGRSCLRELVIRVLISARERIGQRAFHSRLPFGFRRGIPCGLLRLPCTLGFCPKLGSFFCGTRLPMGFSVQQSLRFAVFPTFLGFGEKCFKVLLRAVLRIKLCR